MTPVLWRTGSRRGGTLEWTKVKGEHIRHVSELEPGNGRKVKGVKYKCTCITVGTLKWTKVKGENMHHVSQLEPGNGHTVQGQNRKHGSELETGNGRKGQRLKYAKRIRIGRVKG